MSEPATVTEIASPTEWIDSLPEELKGSPHLEGKTPAEYRAAIDHMAKFQGNVAKTHVKIPSDDTPETDKLAARERILSAFPELRVAEEGDDTPPPKEYTGYKLPEIEDFDVTTLDGLEDISKFAHEHKWGQKQFADYVARMAAGQQESMAGRTEWETAQAAKIAEALGAAKGEHMAQIEAALKAVDAPESYIEALRGGKVDAEVVLMLDKLVDKIVNMGEEGSQFVAQVKNDAMSKTPDQYAEMAAELHSKCVELGPTHPLYQKTNERRMEAIRLAKGL